MSSRSQNYLYGFAFEKAIVNIINYRIDNDISIDDFHEVNSWSEVENIEMWTRSHDVNNGNIGYDGSYRLGYPLLYDELGEQDTLQIYAHASLAVKTLVECGFPMMFGAIRTGQDYYDRGDIELFVDDAGNSKSIEVKYVKRGLGTYNNTSMNAVANAIGYQAYTGPSSFLACNGWYDKLYDIFESAEPGLYDALGISPDIASPLDAESSSEFRKKYPGAYRKIAKAERLLRKDYVDGFMNWLRQDRKLASDLLSMLIAKDVSGKDIPDYFLAFRKSNEKCQLLDMQEALNIDAEEYEQDEKLEPEDIGIQIACEEIYDGDEVYGQMQFVFPFMDDGFIEEEERPISYELRGGYSIVFPGVLRMTFAWQNGTGLCNPTVRTFLLLKDEKHITFS